MGAGFRGDRRDFLKRSAAVAAGAGALPLLTAGTASARRGGAGQLGLVGVDHVGLTVPDIHEAVAWFEHVMGASAPLSFGPISDPQGTLMQDLLGVDPRAVIDRIAVLRIGHSANIELFQYEAPDQRRTHPRNSDWSGHHVAFYVTDIDAAVAHMEAKGVEKLLGPFALTDGPAAGQSINYFKTPFGTYIELISYPHGMAYEAPGVKPLWSPRRNGLRPEVTTVPGLLGIDHVGITVPDVVAAADWLEHVLGGVNPLTFGPFSDPTGDFMEQLVDVDPRAVVEQIRMVRVGNGPGIELFQYDAPDQDQTFRKNSDWGGHHVAFYVRAIDKAVHALEERGARKRFGPFPVTDGPAAGQTINYFRTPFGTDIELISYPHGMAYEATAHVRLWNPRDNHP
ncbi:MAG TPA: VOC family protein [Gaiellaceae bacterium]|nr:VOC family protein [Gaiellaceae bacterium]